jgi:hypothetical protein
MPGIPAEKSLVTPARRSACTLREAPDRTPLWDHQHAANLFAASRSPVAHPAKASRLASLPASDTAVNQA